MTDVRPDPAKPGHFYAAIDPSTYVGFDRPVPFREGANYYERQLRRDDGATSKGAFGRAVRPLSELEYDAILRAGFARELEAERPADIGSACRKVDCPLNLLEDPAEFDRPVIERVLSRPLRDAAFARAVRDAYGATCAMTGLKIINGGGRAEGPGRSHPAGERPRSGFDPQRRGAVGHRPLDVRPRLGLHRTTAGLSHLALRGVGLPDERAAPVPSRASAGTAGDQPDLAGAEATCDYHRSQIFKG